MSVLVFHIEDQIDINSQWNNLGGKRHVLPKQTLNKTKQKTPKPKSNHTDYQYYTI